ncbi:MAG: hypothetical protein WA849_00090 [Candidatus Udaeobacter sp.]
MRRRRPAERQCFWYPKKPRRRMIVRVMGMILCSLAVEIVLTALCVGDWTAGAPR